MVLGRLNQMGDARLGLAIAKKHVKLAVDRNRIKRVIRDSFRQHRKLLAGLDLVVLAKASTAGLSNEQLFSSLEAHWIRLAEIKATSF
jgi:ribonuclease P protein component